MKEAEWTPRKFCFFKQWRTENLPVRGKFSKIEKSKGKNWSSDQIYFQTKFEGLCGTFHTHCSDSLVDCFWITWVSKMTQFILIRVSVKTERSRENPRWKSGAEIAMIMTSCPSRGYLLQQLIVSLTMIQCIEDCKMRNWTVCSLEEQIRIQSVLYRLELSP